MPGRAFHAQMTFCEHSAASVLLSDKSMSKWRELYASYASSFPGERVDAKQVVKNGTNVKAGAVRTRRLLQDPKSLPSVSDAWVNLHECLLDQILWLTHDYTNAAANNQFCVLVPTCDNPKPHLNDGSPLISLFYAWLHYWKTTQLPSPHQSGMPKLLRNLTRKRCRGGDLKHLGLELRPCYQ